MNDSARFDIWEIKQQEDYCGEFDDLALQSFLADLPLSAQEINGFYRTILSDENKMHTLYVRNNWTIDVIRAKSFTSNDQFMSLIHDMYHCDRWADQMMRNIIDEAAGFEDKAQTFEFLDNMLPSEIPRSFIKRLPFIS